MITLFHTDGCHLCDDAEVLLNHAQQVGLIGDYQKLDIATDDELIERYGIRIPVVCINNAELGWPFDYNDLQTFISQHHLKEQG